MLYKKEINLLKRMEKVVFQHLDTVNTKRSDDVWLFGRRMDGKSVAAKIMNIRPHFSLILPDTEDPLTFKEKLKEGAHKYGASCGTLWQYNDSGIPTVSPPVSNLT